MLERTTDPHVLIEERRDGYTRYRNAGGLRWEVVGVCDHNRACMVGAVVGGVLVETVEQARALPTPALDCPVGPGFSGCCDLRIEVL
jgi:hypothetical protein